MARLLLYIITVAKNKGDLRMKKDTGNSTDNNLSLECTGNAPASRSKYPVLNAAEDGGEDLQGSIGVIKLLVSSLIKASATANR